MNDRNNILSDNTLSLTDYSKLGKNNYRDRSHHNNKRSHYRHNNNRRGEIGSKYSISRDSQRPASDSASVN